MANKGYRQISANFIAISGDVVDIGTSSVKGFLAMRVRLRLNTFKRPIYVDVYGFKNVADVMSITCEIGNQVYVEARLSNALVKRETANTVYTPFVQATYVECLSRHKETKVPNPSVISLLDSIDPIGYLNEVKPRKNKDVKSKFKNGDSNSNDVSNRKEVL